MTEEERKKLEAEFEAEIANEKKQEEEKNGKWTIFTGLVNLIIFIVSFILVAFLFYLIRG
jgi:uncharacterized protein YqhQ